MRQPFLKKDASVLTSQKGKGHHSYNDSLFVGDDGPSTMMDLYQVHCSLVQSRNVLFLPRSKARQKDRSSHKDPHLQKPRHQGKYSGDSSEQWQSYLEAYIADILAEGDFLPRDIVYHSSCKTAHWYMYVQKPSKKGYASNRQEPENNVSLVLQTLNFMQKYQIALPEASLLPLEMLKEHASVCYETMEPLTITYLGKEFYRKSKRMSFV